MCLRCPGGWLASRITPYTLEFQQIFANMTAFGHWPEGLLNFSQKVAMVGDPIETLKTYFNIWLQLGRKSRLFQNFLCFLSCFLEVSFIFSIWLFFSTYKYFYFFFKYQKSKTVELLPGNSRTTLSKSTLIANKNFIFFCGNINMYTRLEIPNCSSKCHLVNSLRSFRNK